MLVGVLASAARRTCPCFNIASCALVEVGAAIFELFAVVATNANAHCPGACGACEVMTKLVMKFEVLEWGWGWRVERGRDAYLYL